MEKPAIITTKETPYTYDVEYNTSQVQSKEPITGVRLYLILLGILLSIFAAAMNFRIVSMALNRITSDFQSFDQIAWISTSCLLTITAMEPLYGKFSDIFGRRVMMVFALSVFLLGSILCGSSNSMTMLVICRAIAGLGAGGLISLSTIIVSDIVPLDKRGIYLGIVGASYGMASVIAPEIGGLLANYGTWRWDFYINIPICVLAIIVIMLFLNLPEKKQNLKTKLARIDYAGTITLVAFITFAVLGLNWGGNEYNWISVEVFSSLILSLISLSLFCIIEYKYAVEPIIPIEILNHNVISAAVTAFFNFGGFFSTITYIPIYYQLIKGESTLDSGLELLPLILGAVLTSITSGLLTSFSGNYRISTWIGTILEIAGTSLMGGYFGVDTSHDEIIEYSFIIGAGMGMCVQTNTIVAQAAVDYGNIATATAFVSFCQAMGGVFGTAILGTVYKNVVNDYLRDNIPAGVDLELFIKSSNSSESIDPEILAIVKAGFIKGFKYLFLSSIAFYLVAFLSGLCLKKIPLAENKPEDQTAAKINVL